MRNAFRSPVVTDWAIHAPEKAVAGAFLGITMASWCCATGFWIYAADRTGAEPKVLRWYSVLQAVVLTPLCFLGMIAVMD